jgi:DNA-binding transcriptional ArsR family regulator
MSASRRDLPTDVAKALSHPLRQRLLVLYSQESASPSEVAHELNEPIGDVAYHTKRLVEHGFVELVGTVKSRGGVKRRYRATRHHEFEDEIWSGLAAPMRGSLGERAVSEIGHAVASGAAVGGFADEDVHLSRIVLRLDERGRRELSQVLRETVARADAIAEESAQRGGTTRRSVLSVMHFRTEER